MAEHFQLPRQRHLQGEMPVLRGTDSLLRLVYIRTSSMYGRVCPNFGRKFLEMFVLVAAVSAVFILLYSHSMISKTSVNCLGHVEKPWSRPGILRLEVVRTLGKEYTLEMSYDKEDMIRRQSVITLYFNFVGQILNYLLNVWNGGARWKKYRESALKTNFIVNDTELNVNFRNSYILEYSLDDGVLKMEKKFRKELNIPVEFIVIDPDTNKCLRNPFNKFLLDNLLGYNELLSYSIKKYVVLKPQLGYLRNVVSELYYQFMIRLIIVTGPVIPLLCMTLFTVSISVFTTFFRNEMYIFISNTSSFYSFTSMVIPIFILIGLELVMEEYFGDRITTICVIFIVWAANKFYVICCNSPISKRHWVKFYYLYQYMFFVFNYKYRGEFGKFALLTWFLLTLHSMIFFVHRFELPTILSVEQLITNPRVQRRRPMFIRRHVVR